MLALLQVGRDALQGLLEDLLGGLHGLVVGHFGGLVLGVWVCWVKSLKTSVGRFWMSEEEFRILQAQQGEAGSFASLVDSIRQQCPSAARQLQRPLS